MIRPLVKIWFYLNHSPFGRFLLLAVPVALICTYICKVGHLNVFGLQLPTANATSGTNSSDPRLNIAVACIAAYVAAWTLFINWSIKRQEYTLQYLKTLEIDKDVIAAIKAFNDFANEYSDISIIHDTKGAESDILKNHIRVVLNNDELIAIGIKFGSLDYRLCATWMKSILSTRYSKAQSYIEKARVKYSKPFIYKELEKLVGRIRDDEIKDFF